jgi:hypothetical protein
LIENPQSMRSMKKQIRLFTVPFFHANQNIFPTVYLVESFSTLHLHTLTRFLKPLLAAPYAQTRRRCIRNGQQGKGPHGQGHDAHLEIPRRPQRCPIHGTVRHPLRWKARRIRRH